jgi:hypothetical protein
MFDFTHTALMTAWGEKLEGAHRLVNGRTVDRDGSLFS